MAKLAKAMADVAYTMFAFTNANEIPTAKASMLVATDKSKMFAMVRFFAAISSPSFSPASP